MYFGVVNYANLKRSDHLHLLKEKDNRIANLLFELGELKRVLFGSKSERFIPSENPEQLAFKSKEFVKEKAQIRFYK